MIDCKYEVRKIDSLGCLVVLGRYKTKREAQERLRKAYSVYSNTLPFVINLKTGKRIPLKITLGKG